MTFKMIGRCTHVVDCRATGGMGKGGGLAQRGTFAECGAEVLAVAMSPGRRQMQVQVFLMMLQLLVVHYLVSLIRKWNK